MIPDPAVDRFAPAPQSRARLDSPQNRTRLEPATLAVVLTPETETETARGVLAAGAQLARQLKATWRVVRLAWPGSASDESLDFGAYRLPELVELEVPSAAGELPLAQADLLADALRADGARLVVLAHDDPSSLLAPRLAALLGAGLLTEVLSVEPAGTGELLLGRSAIGDRLGEVRLWRNPDPLVLTLRSASLSGVPAPGTGPETAPPARVILRLELPPDTDGCRIEERVAADPETVGLEDAQVVFAAGKGLDWDSFVALRELARLAGASIGVTRPVYDMGWAEFERLVGQTGKTVSPRLYLAVGISGSAHHVGGISEAGRIVSLNLDHRAPIFSICDEGFVGDAGEVLPLLLEKVRRRVAERSEGDPGGEGDSWRTSGT